MATLIRPEISEKNKYYIDKHRYYELKHFCLQYPLWKNSYYSLENASILVSKTDGIRTTNTPSNPTCKNGVLMAYYAEKINLLEKIAVETDEYLHKYILKAITEGLSYTSMKTKYDIPCGKDMYYDRYRRFFWLLSEARN